MLTEIIQEVHNLIGSQEDIEALAKKEHARILVISDSHGRIDIVENIIRNYGAGCDALAFCGDGAGDLLNLLVRVSKDEEFSKCVPSVVAFARGNGDPSAYPVGPLQTFTVPNKQIFTVNGHNLMVVHGHREGVDFGMENLGLEMQLEGCNVGFYGHTHIAREENSNGYKFVNPGSCARPRGGQPAGFAIATVEKTFVDIAFIKLEIKNGCPDYSLWHPLY